MVQKTIVDYRVVTCVDKKKFEEAVYKMIVDYGYELYGSLSTVNDGGIIYHQTMILYKKDEFSNLKQE